MALAVSLQEQVANHRKRLGSKAPVVSVAEKVQARKAQLTPHQGGVSCMVYCWAAMILVSVRLFKRVTLLPKYIAALRGTSF